MDPTQPIQPLTTHREINVVEPVSPAFERVKLMLFRPFDLGKWFVIGFCAWLAFLGEAGSGFGGQSNFGNHTGRNGTDFRHDLDQARDYLLNNLDWIIPLAAFSDRRHPGAGTALHCGSTAAANSCSCIAWP